MTIEIIASNRKARRDFSISETIECGIELKGGEVKSLRQAKANLNDSFARLDSGEVFLYNCYITPYEQSSAFSRLDPIRPRKLLLHKSQIRKFFDKVSQRGLTLIPLKIYFNQRGYAKVELALAKGRRLFDKRKAVKERQLKRDLKRATRRR